MASTATPSISSAATSNIPTSDTPASEAEGRTGLSAADRAVPNTGVNRVASSSFDKPGADIILRSSNNVDFYVYKAVLLLASDFFETMFSLTQPPSDAAGTLDGRPVIDVPETSDTLDTLLRFCYPVDDPEALTMDNLGHALAAAIKYELREATKILRHMLHTYVSEKPREVYALACRHNLEAEAVMAAKRWKELVPPVQEAADFAHTLPGVTFIPEMQNISAIAYYNLLSYLRSGKTPTQFCGDTGSLRFSGGIQGGSSPLFTRGDADIILRSSDDVDFRVHRFILTMNDGDDFVASGVRVGEVNNLPVFQMAVSTSVLRELLKLCYPSGIDTQSHSTKLHSDVCDAMIQTATRYKMEAVLRCIKRNLKDFLGQEHLSRYLIAARHGWDPEAQEAARCLLKAPLHNIHSAELRRSMAPHYQALLEFDHRYQMALMQAHAKFAVYNPSLFGAFGDGGWPVDVREGQWKKQWFLPRNQVGFGFGSDAMSEYPRSAPSVLVEVAVERYKRQPSSISFPGIAGQARKLEYEAAQAVKDLKVNLET